MGTFADAIHSKKFVVTTELTPPKGMDLTELFSKADLLKDYIDACNVTESPRARLKMDPKAVAHLLLDRGLDPIVQVTSRDRNRIALQADLLGAAALGIRNFLFMIGDLPANGDHPDAKGVFDLSTTEMLAAARTLAEGRDLAGHELHGAPTLFIGATANPAADNLKAEVDNVRRKIDAGAQFLQTQAIYDIGLLEKFLDAAKLDGTAVLAGIIPLKSARTARWLNANVFGIRVPEQLIHELEGVAGTEHEGRKGIDIAARIVRDVRKLCAGAHIMAMGWERYIPEILEASGVRAAKTP